MKWTNRSIGVFFLFAFMLLLVGCSSADQHQELLTTNDMEAGFAIASESAVVENEKAVDSGEAPLSFSERKVIYNASLSLEVQDYAKAMEQIQERIKQVGGYVVNSSANKIGDNEMSGYLTARVPQAHFQSFLDDVESIGMEVRERYVEGNDVTEEYIDLESRLRAKQAVEKRLLEFMDKAENTESLLKVSSDLAKVQEEIEQIVGRITYLDNHVDYSTVTVHLRAKLVTVSSIQNDQLHTWTKAKRLFMDTINGLISFFSALVIGLIGLSPLFVPLVIVFGMMIYVKKRRKKQAERPTKQE